MDIWIWVVVALLAGALVGGAGVYLFARRRWADAKRAEEVQRELDDYRHDVSDHFVQTAELVNNLTRSYKAVYDHLEQGAYRLVDEETLRKQLGDVDAEAVRLEYIGRRNKAAVLGDGAPEGAAAGASASARSRPPGEGATEAPAWDRSAQEGPTGAKAWDRSVEERAAQDAAWSRPAEEPTRHAPAGWTTTSTGAGESTGTGASTGTSEPTGSEESTRTGAPLRTGESTRAGESTRTQDSSGAPGSTRTGGSSGDTPWVSDAEEEPEREEAARADGRLR